MRLLLVFASILCTLASAGRCVAAPADTQPTNGRNPGLSVRVEGGGWGSVRKERIEAVLYLVADELLGRMPERLTAPIVVTHTNSNPVALYDRGQDGEHLVQLHASDGRWHLYAYEFAHELCHIMSNFSENASSGSDKYNQWFEEALCETASLFTLRNLAAKWETSPPFPEWTAQAQDLRRFADRLLDEGHRRLPPQTPLSAWLRDNEERLRGDPYQREKNELVANLLLPLFQSDPRRWDALCYLNLHPADGGNDLRQYLRNWYDNAPPEHRDFIFSVLDLLGVSEVIQVGLAGPEDAPSAASRLSTALAGQAGRSGE